MHDILYIQMWIYFSCVFDWFPSTLKTLSLKSPLWVPRIVSEMYNIFFVPKWHWDCIIVILLKRKLFIKQLSVYLLFIYCLLPMLLVIGLFHEVKGFGSVMHFLNIRIKYFLIERNDPGCLSFKCRNACIYIYNLNLINTREI